MINFFSNIFGYVLNFIYEIVKNYGLAIILFTLLIKVLLLPLTIKQQKTMKKTQKIQGEIKEIQEKYKDNPEKLNQETMALYKRENMSPFSGCLSSIIQLLLILAVFYMVRSPLTFMKKVDVDTLNVYKEKIALEKGENSLNTAYPEISIVKYINNKIENKEEEPKTDVENTSAEEEKELADNEESIKEEEKKDEQVESLEINKDLYINMNFLGLDLGSIPKENYKDYKVFIIPVLYIISSFISIKLMPGQMTKEKKKVEEKKEEENKEENKIKTEQEDMTANMTKNMTWMMPILAVSVSLIAPLGLALYWLVSNILMILERVLCEKLIVSEEENKND